MKGCLRCIRGRKNALDFCKGRMLGKDDPFKVVLDPARDPGADKRGLLRSGQVLSHGKNTGGACMLSPSGTTGEGCCIGTTQPFQFNVASGSGQFVLLPK